MTKPGMCSLVCIWQDGREQIIESGRNWRTVLDAESRIARDKRVIKRIELRDPEGARPIWDASWNDYNVATVLRNERMAR